MISPALVLAFFWNYWLLTVKYHTVMGLEMSSILRPFENEESIPHKDFLLFGEWSYSRSLKGLVVLFLAMVYCFCQSSGRGLGL